MKSLKTIILLILLSIIINKAKGTQILDIQTVYNPATNSCIDGFGGLIKSQDIIERPNANQEVYLIRDLLIDWINEKNYPGFYLQELDPTNFYWQFVETKKYVGAILIVTDKKIDAKFYSTLGSGLSTPGYERYGTYQSWNNNDDIFSFVIDKDILRLDHFENWKFSQNNQTTAWMTKSHVHKLLSKNTY